MNLNVRPKSECKFDAVSLGEVMLRLDLTFKFILFFSYL